MNIHELRKLSKLQHFSNMQTEKFITDFGLYDSLLIETDSFIRHDQDFCEGVVSYVTPSLDVESLHKFSYLSTPIMLPCPYCGRLQAFMPNAGYKNSINKLPNWTHTTEKKKDNMANYFAHGSFGYIDNKNNKESKKRFEEELQYADFIERVKYSFEDNRIYTNPYNIFDQTMDYDRVKDIVARKIMEGIMNAVNDLRKDFVCCYEGSHHLFIEFSLFPAVDNIPEELKYYQDRVKENINAVMTDVEKEVLSLYNSLRYCLVARKIAQYPSMADIQFFDKVKYKPVLEKQYTDYTMALGLYACGVGAGAFVYLRRIMESIVEEFHRQCVDLNGWDEEEYGKRRFNEKIKYIEDFGKEVIPVELKGIKNELYGVLSNGVHSASEDECKKLFPYMKFAIETFLDRKVEDREKRKRIEEMNREVKNVNNS